MTTVQPIPPGFHTLTPHLVVYDAAAAIEFYKRAFGATECHRMMAPDGKRIMHASLMIGDSPLMLADEFREFCSSNTTMGAPTTVGGTTVTIHMYFENVDEAFDRAVLAGAEVTMPLMDMFWGDRYGKVKDPFGHEWSLAQHVRDMSPQDMEREMKACMTAGAGASK